MEFKDLLVKAKEGNDYAIKQILDMYRPLIIKHALVNGVFDEDLFQELTVEILKCIHSFKVLD